MRRKLFASLGVAALVGLSACGSGSSVAKPTALPSSAPITSSSPAPSATESSSPAAEPTTEAPSSSPAAEPTTAAPTPESDEETVAAAPNLSTEVAAPGTNCGRVNASEFSAFVFGGPTSCQEAMTVMQKFDLMMTPDHFQDGKRTTPAQATVDGYECKQDNVIARDTGTYATCVHPGHGGYIQLRVSSLQPIPGHVANVPWSSAVSKYVFAPAGSSKNIACWTTNGFTVTCEVSTGRAVPPANGKVGGYVATNLVTLGGDTVDISEGGLQGVTAEMDAAIPIDIGTTVNFYDFSCQPLSVDSVTCRSSAGKSFTISPQGVVEQ